MIPRMTLPRFEFFAPESLDEALELLSEYGDRARVKAGGTDLLIRMRKRLVTPDVLIGLSRLKHLEAIVFDEEKGLSIGAMARLAQVADNEHIRNRYPAVAYAASITATNQIRNLGTVVGNLCNASPSADNAPSLIAMKGEAVLASVRGKRIVPLDAFFLGPGVTVREHDELVTEVRVLRPGVGTGCAYQFISMRSKVDIAAVSVGVMVVMDGETIREARVVLGAVASTPLRSLKASEVLTGAKVNDALLQEASRAAMEEACPISDCRACDEYRKRMVGVLTRRALHQAISDVRNDPR